LEGLTPSRTSAKNWKRSACSWGERQTRFESRPVPAGAVYFLGGGVAKPHPVVEAVPSSNGTIGFGRGHFRNKVLDREMRAKEFDVLGRTGDQRSVPQVFRMTIPRGSHAN